MLRCALAAAFLAAALLACQTAKPSPSCGYGSCNPSATPMPFVQVADCGDASGACGAGSSLPADPYPVNGFTYAKYFWISTRDSNYQGGYIQNHGGQAWLYTLGEQITQKSGCCYTQYQAAVGATPSGALGSGGGLYAATCTASDPVGIFPTSAPQAWVLNPAFNQAAAVAAYAHWRADPTPPGYTTATLSGNVFDAGGNSNTYGDYPTNTQFNGSNGASTFPCQSGTTAYTQVNWVQSVIEPFVAALPEPIWINGSGVCPVGGAGTGSPAPVIYNMVAPNAALSRAEDWAVRKVNTGPDSDLRNSADTGAWLCNQNTTIISVATYGKPIVEMDNMPSTDPTDATGQTLRTYFYASYLLTFSPPYTIVWWNTCRAGNANCPTTGLVSPANIFPEGQFYCTGYEQPISTYPSDITNLNVAASEFAAEFHNCYFRSQRVGSGAVVVNAHHVTAASWPSGGAFSDFANYTSPGCGDCSTFSLAANPAALLDGGPTTLGGLFAAGGYAPATVPALTGVIVIKTSGT